MSLLDQWRTQVKLLKREVVTLYLAVRDPRTPLAARLLAGMVVAYALSPIDLIPDFIPFLGYLDDLLLLPLGILLVRTLIPPVILTDCRVRAEVLMETRPPVNWVAGAVIIALWLLLLWWAAHWGAAVWRRAQ